MMHVYQLENAFALKQSVFMTMHLLVLKSSLYPWYFERLNNYIHIYFD